MNEVILPHSLSVCSMPLVSVPEDYDKALNFEHML